MIVVTDGPETFAPYWGEASWAPVPDPDIIPSWSRIDQGQPVFSADVVSDAAQCGSPYLLVIDQAGRSQYDLLLEGMRQGSFMDGLAAIALEGQGFHGNRGRPWTASRGNIHLCAMYEVRKEASFLKAGLSMVPTIAVAETLLGLDSGFTPGIKWVNDVELHGTKVSGTLTSTLASGPVIDCVLFGIGVNVFAVPEVEASPFVPEAGCLFPGEGHNLLLFRRVLTGLLRNLKKQVARLLDEGPGALLDQYSRYSCIRGDAVRVWDEALGQDLSALRNHHALAAGVVEGFDEDLGLWLEGHSEPVRRGRLVREAACRRYGL